MGRRLGILCYRFRSLKFQCTNYYKHVSVKVIFELNECQVVFYRDIVYSCKPRGPLWCAELFWRNPQFGITLPASSADDQGDVAYVVVSLMQESKRLDENFSVGFMIYKVQAGFHSLFISLRLSSVL